MDPKTQSIHEYEHTRWFSTKKITPEYCIISQFGGYLYNVHTRLNASVLHSFTDLEVDIEMKFLEYIQALDIDTWG